MPSQHTHAPDARRSALNHRLRRLKAFALGGAVALSLGAWGLVSGAVAASTAPATPTTTITTPTVSVNRSDDGFFGGGSSLGSGVAQRPVARSRGS